MSDAPGGFLEPCSSTVVRERPRLTLPERGPFDFPAPWGTRGIRITNGSDMGYADALWYCGYSYWQNINAHAGKDHLLIFLGVDRQRGGYGPSLWKVDKATEAVTFLGPIFPPEHKLSWSTGEGWYWSRTNPDWLYVNDTEHLYRYDVRAKILTTVVDITEPPYAGSGKFLWQWHTAADDKTHSATVKDAADYSVYGFICYREGRTPDPWWFWWPVGSLDEVQIDASGEWLLAKDNTDSRNGEDNRLIRLADMSERTILDEQGAAGHSDNGHGYVLFADNWNDLPGAYCVRMFDAAQTPQKLLVYHTSSWSAECSHVSHCNARPGPPSEQIAVGSSASRTLAPRNNEIVGFRLDGSLDCLCIAPVLTDMNAPGGGNDYAKMPKGNIDPSGEFFLWTSNLGGSRLDALLVRVPSQLLLDDGDDTGPCAGRRYASVARTDDGPVLHLTTRKPRAGWFGLRDGWPR
jgi:hypothetical protein